MAPFLSRKTMRHFLPFMILIVGGSFLLREFADVRYKFRSVVSYDIKKDFQEKGIEVKKSASLEEEYENTMKKLNIDNWENVRIPRPWDEKDSTKN
ncbi:PREDICTED: cytochrome c oxidase assembly protein COX16 homolog, mitochondrial [Dufourea novaeangliae]|uniref:cytochrome c oxidase assembly protein COX16 homolog, mitochondrial n=1 Tax=Dufourea novaeangliae TaxID=178035 RepID=UPI0007670A2E|nr:PREDICTED: cytochrome c oxidase assembly protein COX16 homolog, mitochondrial [Dufourea novaeangliae]